MNVTIQINGLDKLQDLVFKYPLALEKQVNIFITKSLATVYGNMAQITPVDTARLREDLHVPHVSPFQGYMGSKLSYAAKVHNLYSEGTMYKNPSKNKNAVAGFLSLAAKQSQPAIEGFCSEAIAGTLKEISF